MKKFAIIISISLSVFMFLGGCAKQESFAVKVNDKVIPQKLYEDKLKAVKSYFKKQGVDLEKAENQASLDSVKNEVLEGLIGAELIKQEIAKNGWDLKDPEILKQIEELKSQLAGNDYEKWLQEQAMTEEEVIEHYAFTNNVAKDVTVSEQEIMQYFEWNLSRYGGQDEQVKARHILVEKEEEALAIINELKGEKDFTSLSNKFAEIAKEKSIEPAAKNSGGELGYFTRGQMVAPFEEAAFSQEVGKLSDKPVKTDFGYHVILVEDHKQAVKPDFDKAKEAVEKDALDYAKNQRIQSYYLNLRQGAKIEYAEELKPKNS